MFKLYFKSQKHLVSTQKKRIYRSLVVKYISVLVEFQIKSLQNKISLRVFQTLYLL